MEARAIKEKQKENKPPHLAYLSAKREQEREKEHSWKKARNKVISLFSLIVSRPNTSISTKNLKTYLNKKKSKEKARRKEEERRKKEEEGQSKQLNLQNLHQTQVYHVHNAISKVGVFNSSHKSYLRLMKSMLD